MAENQIDWRHIDGLAPYAQTLAAMEARVAEISAGTAPESIWLLEHPPLYTAGTSSNPADLTDPDRFEVHVAGRGAGMAGLFAATRVRRPCRRAHAHRRRRQVWTQGTAHGGGGAWMACPRMKLCRMVIAWPQCLQTVALGCAF